MGILQAKLNVGQKAALEVLYGVPWLLHNALQAGRKQGKGFVTHILEKLSLIFEIEIDGGWRIFDLFGDAPHGDVFVSFLDEELAGRVEDLLAEEFFLAEFAFFNAH